MRLFNLTLACRLDDEGTPAVTMEFDFQDGAPVEHLAIAPQIMRNVADQIEQKVKDGTANDAKR